MNEIREITFQSEQSNADTRKSDENEVLEFLRGTRAELSTRALELFVPERVREIADDPTKIKVRPLVTDLPRIGLYVFEQGSPQTLTDEGSWNSWLNDIEAALKAQAGKPMRVIPEAPKDVNRMHAKFREEIERGELTLHDRILLKLRLSIHPEHDQAIFVSDFDGESHQGIGRDFYQNTLPSVAKDMGMRFIVGQNRTGNISFFTDTLSRYTLEEIRPEFRVELFPSHGYDNYFTIQFLYDEDVKKYIIPEKIKKHENRT